MEGLLVLLFFIGSSIFVFAFLIFSAKGNTISKISSAKFPAPFSSSLSRKEVLTAVEERLTQIQSLRQQWKTTEKVEKIGRYQAKITVPFDLSGSNIQISFLLNLLATSRDAGGCTVEWTYVMMSPLAHTPAQITLLENKVYTITTLEIKSALFMAQGDEEEADYLISGTKPLPEQLEPKPAHEPLVVRMGRSGKALSRSQSPEPSEPASTEQAPEEQPQQEAEPQPEPARSNLDVPLPPLPDIVDAELHSLGKPNTNLAKSPMHVAQSIPGTTLPDLTAEELKNIGGTTGDPSLMQVPEVQAQMPDVRLQMPEVNSQMPEVKSQVPDVNSQMPEVKTSVPDVSSEMPDSSNTVPGLDLKLGEVSNPLNFSPSDPPLSSSTSQTKDAKCVKCSQDRDPSFNFCLYCGHTDT